MAKAAAAEVAVADKLLWSVEEASALTGFSRSRLYVLIGRKQIISVKVGKARKIPAAEMRVYVDRIVAEQRLLQEAS